MNIFLLISDTFRYDNFFDRAAAGPMGMPVRTPNLDAFSERAVSFSRAYASSFPTIPHRTDLTSGRYGWPWYGWQDLTKSTRNHLPRLLSKSGYATQLLCDCPHLFNSHFHKTFNASYATRGQEGDLPFLHMNDPIEHALPPEKTRPSTHFRGATLADLAGWTNRNWGLEEQCFGYRTAGLAARWLEENYRFDPTFLWVDFFDPHEPWNPPEYMVRRYDEDYEGPAMIHANYGRADDYTPAELKNLRAHYCAEAELVDRWVGRVLQKIDDLRLWDNSIVIFTSDHGFSIGERNRTGKTNIHPRDDRCWPIYPEVAHVPLLIAAPGLEGGREIGELVQPVDLLPTLLDLTGTEAEPPEPIHGHSLAPLLRGESAGPVRDVAITAGHLRPGPDTGPRITSKRTTPVVYTKRWAYAPIGAAATPELYDLTADPYALTNLADRHGDVVKDLHAELLAFLTDLDAPAEAISVFED